MNISKSKVRVESSKPTSPPKSSALKQSAASTVATSKATSTVKKTPKPTLQPIKTPIAGLSSSNDNVMSLQQMLASAKQELELIRRMRADTIKYQQQTATKARSEAHQLVLYARLTTQREIEEVIRQASEEIQKVLADIRVTRITAQEELATQRRYTDAAKLNSLSLSFQKAFQNAIEHDVEKKPEIVKP
jgi:hypothetical protein